MNITVNRMAKMSITFLMLTVLLSLFENCSGSGFKGSEDAEFASVSSVGPTLTVTNLPSQLTKVSGLDISITTTTNQFATITSTLCTLDSSAPVSCLSTFSTTGLADGFHTLKVQAVDSLGNASNEFDYTWQVDTTAPIVTFSMAPPSVSGASAALAFVADDPAAAFICALDTPNYTACTSPLALANLTQGSHTLNIRATDLAGNVSAVLTDTFRTDINLPVVTIATNPTTPTNSTTANFTFTGIDAGKIALTNFSCELDATTAAACNSGSVTYTALSAGAHTFTLIGQDLAGNKSSAVTFKWTVDLTAPTVPVITASVGALTNTTTATFKFASTDASGIKSYICQLDATTAATCSTLGAQTYSGLSSAPHTFKVQAVDVAGNTSAAATFAWTINTVAPKIALSQQPTNPTTSTTATFAFTATDAVGVVSNIMCQLDTAAFAACTSPVTLTNLSVASHTFTIRATDTAANTTNLPTTWVVTAANTNPTTPTPPVGAVVGDFKTLAYNDDFTKLPLGSSSVLVNAKIVDANNTQAPGFHWYATCWFCRTPMPAGDLSVVSDNGTHALRINGATNASIYGMLKGKSGIVGNSFKGGMYIEARIANAMPANGTNTWPAFWALQNLGDQGLGWPGSTSTSLCKGTVGTYDVDTEIDIMEYMPLSILGSTVGSASGTYHNWYGVQKCSCGTGQQFCQNVGSQRQLNSTSVPLQSTAADPIFNTFAVLIVPATATTQGYSQYYYNDKPLGNKVTWVSTPPVTADPVGLMSGKPIVQGPSSLIPNFAWGSIELYPYSLILSSGGGAFMDVQYVRVWQK